MRAGLGAVTAFIDRVISVIACLLLAFAIIANGLEIARRALFDYSFLWLYETNLLLSNWMYFLGMCLVYYRRQDITIDFVLFLVRGRARQLFLALINLVGATTFAAIGWYGSVLMRLQWPFRTTGSDIPTPLFTLPVVLSAGFIVIILIKQTLDIIADGGAAGEPAIGGEAE